MRDDSGAPMAPTRREALGTGGAVIGGGLLAGCMGASGDGDGSGDTDVDDGEKGNATGSAETVSYEVCMEPNGCHSFDAVPEEFLVYHQGPVDMMLSLGQADGLVAAGYPSTFPTAYYDQLPGISVDLSDVRATNEDGTPDKELFYELDVDVHLVGHHPAMEYYGLDESDIEELEANVAPFHGSWMRRPDYTDGHPYYGLYEGLDRYAAVFRTEERGDAYRALHDEVVTRLTDRFPPVDERPSVAFMNHNYWEDHSEVYIRDPSAPGYQNKPVKDLEIPRHDAFAGEHPVEATDLELLLEADPDAIVYHAGLNTIRDPETSFEDDLIAPLREDPVAGEVTAIAEDNVYPWHEIEQGPVINLFNLELLAKGLYPEEFGEPTGMEAPPEEERLFDRQRVADIIAGEV